MTNDLRQKHCESCEGIGQTLNAEQILNLLSQLHERWQVVNEHQAIKRSFSFDNFYETMAFVNAVAWIANVENHHPDLEVGYNYCHITFMTHALNGLTANDFICAAKIDGLLAE
ncbi:pterin 4 alpha carbinolamine dehydratase [Legionella quinlivanii]|uniref:Putative pterin-4-alpha-carbinolamine dehydratase n=1 Tax=Legionella quinlivanii TaxID=45073 RepID=A0A0W0XLA8_9GAMM|nr:MULTISPECIES: 4a-hydroxytetrahydrobiopterin dehydratase [Legionella]KTD45336.1 pterin 4 alpha carbinolamine dehydratase [Legionella quinlivanii]MCE3044315.1 4a-hydroxytetrahydrobiopterin dehydratase [Legionella sp. 16cNR16C]MCW8451389.1 4a-hydroxytetrahydrobiopterin dehydratase [Legionella quinlivanii]RAP36920.1 4a-hydroxytetrahydrobiopterin dehydratase [Legionella quinlivanii]SEG15705.1 pterin-4-alpha-carbinolamine dehydratase [Legionella quinlivanii DSM 21216]